MKFIELDLEDMETIKQGWGLIKQWEGKGPPAVLDNMIILTLKPLDKEIQKLVSTKQLTIKMTELPGAEK